MSVQLGQRDRQPCRWRCRKRCRRARPSGSSHRICSVAFGTLSFTVAVMADSGPTDATPMELVHSWGYTSDIKNCIYVRDNNGECRQHRRGTVGIQGRGAMCVSLTCGCTPAAYRGRVSVRSPRRAATHGFGTLHVHSTRQGGQWLSVLRVCGCLVASCIGLQDMYRLRSLLVANCRV